jgi:hypothetical protein
MTTSTYLVPPSYTMAPRRDITPRPQSQLVYEIAVQPETLDTGVGLTGRSQVREAASQDSLNRLCEVRALLS